MLEKVADAVADVIDTIRGSSQLSSLQQEAAPELTDIYKEKEDSFKSTNLETEPTPFDPKKKAALMKRYDPKADLNVSLDFTSTYPDVPVLGTGEVPSIQDSERSDFFNPNLLMSKKRSEAKSSTREQHKETSERLSESTGEHKRVPFAQAMMAAKPKLSFPRANNVSNARKVPQGQEAGRRT